MLRRAGAQARVLSGLERDGVRRRTTVWKTPGPIENLGSWARLDDGDVFSYADLALICSPGR